MNNIIEVPDNINGKFPDRIMIGSEILRRFYNQGYWKNKDYIYYKLKEINWKPNSDEEYLVWYHHTNPADPADPGEDFLDYVEPINFFKDYLICRVRNKIESLSPNELLKLARQFNLKFTDKT